MYGHDEWVLLEMRGYGVAKLGCQSKTEGFHDEWIYAGDDVAVDDAYCKGVAAKLFDPCRLEDNGSSRSDRGASGGVEKTIDRVRVRCVAGIRIDSTMLECRGVLLKVVTKWSGTCGSR